MVKIQPEDKVYKNVYSKECPYSNKDKKVGEHIYVWWKNGRKIPKGSIIHHINGDSQDNRIENLKCMSRKEHSILHKKNSVPYKEETYNKILDMIRKGKKYKEIQKFLGITKQNLYYYTSILREKGLIEKKKELEKVKGKESFYLSILKELETTTNLTKIQKNLSISKQKLNYYLRRMKVMGLIIHKGKGWYEPVKGVKDLTKYQNILSKDSVRGHAYIWNIKLPQETPQWRNRIEVLKRKGTHYILVGALKTTPRIKILGRKVWLCNDHLRIFDKKNNSYYGLDAKESRYSMLLEIKLIVRAVSSKLGISLNPIDIEIQREHYALIKNDLAIEENKRGNIWRIKDEDGEWLLVDDSLEKGGELETIGKKAYKTNIPLQRWWNEQKETKFEVTPSFILNSMNGIQKNQSIFDANMSSHLEVLENIGQAITELKEEVKRLNGSKGS